MTDAVYLEDGGAFAPTGHARGPWDPGQQHGGAPSALVARAIEALAPEMALTRLTLDFQGVVPVAPLTVGAELVRKGRRLQQAEATVTAGGRDVVRARASLYRRTELDGLPPSGLTPLAGPPDAGEPLRYDDGGGDAFGLTAMDIRFVQGSWREGPSQTWFHLRIPLVAGEEPTGVQRAAAAADFPNGVSAILDWAEWLFINTDLTVTLFRPPRGVWIGLDAQTVLDASGAGMATAVLHDLDGPIGRSQQTLLVERR